MELRSFFARTAMKAAESLSGGAIFTDTGGRAVPTQWDDQKSAEEGYFGSTYVFKAVDWRSKIADVEWSVHRSKPGQEDEEVKEHELIRLLERPNPVMSWSNFVQRCVQFHDISEKGAPIYKIRNKAGQIIELWPVPPAFLTIIAGDKQYTVKEYHYEVGNQKFVIPKEDLIMWQQPNPLHPHLSTSLVKIAGKALDTDMQARDWNLYAMGNKAIPSGIMATKEKITKPQLDEAKQQWTETQQGPQNAMKTMFVSGGFSYQRLSMTNEEMDFIESRKFNREEITAVFGVPLVLMGIMDGATYANYAEARLSFWEDTALPLLGDFVQLINHHIAHEMEDDVWLKIDEMSIPALRERQLNYAQTGKTFLEMGYTLNSINDRLKLGFDNSPSGDISYIPSGLIPVDNYMPDPYDDDDDGLEVIDQQQEEIEDDIAALSKQLASITSEIKQETKAGAKTGPDDWKARHWKSIEIKRVPFDSAFKAAIAKQFRREGERVTKKMTRESRAAARNYIKSKKNRDEWLALYEANYTRILNRFGQEASEQLKGFAPTETKSEPFEFDPYDKFVQDWIKDTAAQRVSDVLDSSRKDIAKIVSDGITNNQTSEDIAEVIAGKYRSFSVSRSFSIARTEVAGASNYSLYAAGEQAPFQVNKTWINSADDRVRDEHQFTETVPMDAPFSNGLMFPADPGGDAEEVINCRCTIAYEREAVDSDAF